ncbi:CLUMA_CG003967, isoform A [Clunio marinus]|uniref:CLUMA_CG003967, isoform A n=1 Tax=Clunio marinus TaxID=568069 RepID=A0A1J1HQB8_9DIPT|nr:CLUMA_CG003967, isoform A [Clunio marinus]
MKLSVGVSLLFLIIGAQSAAIESSKDGELITEFVISPDFLFENAQRYLAFSKDVQRDIDETFITIRTAVSAVLKTASGTALDEIEGNSVKILEMDSPARNAIFDLDGTPCTDNLKQLLNLVTEFSGFGSSNCVSFYDRNVQKAVDAANELFRDFEGDYMDMQQIVVRSFVGKNIFLQAEDIQARFIQEFNRRSEAWYAVRPEVDEYIRTLNSSIDNYNNELRVCFNDIQVSIAPIYDNLEGQIRTCEEFDNTPNPFASFMH